MQSTAPPPSSAPPPSGAAPLAGFFKLNITHIVAAIVYCCSLIWATSRDSAERDQRVSALDARLTAQHLALATAITTTRAERMLQVDALSLRVVKVEGQQAAIEELLREMRAVSVRVNHLGDRMNELRDDLKFMRQK